MLIGITGKKRVGKDTVAQYLLQELPNSCRIAFADELKKECADMIAWVKKQNIPNNCFEICNLQDIYRSNINIIKWLTVYFDFSIIQAIICLNKIITHFSLPHKHLITNYEDNKTLESKIFLEMNSNNKEKYRILLQWWGTEFKRNIDANYWINKLKQNIPKESSYIIIPDVRFKNEALFVKNNGIIIKVVSDFIKQNDLHQSENELNDYNDYDYIINNNSTIENLYQQIKTNIIPNII